MALALAPAFAAPSAPASGSPRAAAPDFRIRAVTGEKLELAALRARGPVLIDFWATWCAPCLASLPEIQSLYRHAGSRGLSVIGVSIDGPRNHAKVRPFAARLGLTFPIVLDEDGRLQESFKVRVIPTTILIDTSGTVALVTQGYRPGEGARLEAAVAALLGSGSRADSAAADSTAATSRP
jgi:cytochrome c biogenesis protein CcmG/thiol:disulfide interchange protein DsbE